MDRRLPPHSGWSPDDQPPRPVLIAGAPRSGTTWVEQVLGRTRGAFVVHEPDNETCDPFALRAKAQLGRFPVLRPGDSPPADYLELWERAFSGHVHRSSARYMAAKALLKTAGDDLEAAFDRATRRLSPRLHFVSGLAEPPGFRHADAQTVVKSVHVSLALEWIAQRFRPKVLVVLRHPLNILASHIELGWHDSGLDTQPLLHPAVTDLPLPALPPGASDVARMTWQIGASLTALELAAQRNPRWHVVTHEVLCRDPQRGFRAICRSLDLEWTSRAAAFLAAANRPGAGMTTRRVAGEQHTERWRTRLSAEQRAEAEQVLEGFPSLARGVNGRFAV